MEIVNGATLIENFEYHRSLVLIQLCAVGVVRRNLQNAQRKQQQQHKRQDTADLQIEPPMCPRTFLSANCLPALLDKMRNDPLRGGNDKLPFLVMGSVALIRGTSMNP